MAKPTGNYYAYLEDLRTSTDPEHLDAAACSSRFPQSTSVLYTILSNKYTSDDTIRYIFETVKRGSLMDFCIAEAPSCPLDVLEQLCLDEDKRTAAYAHQAMMKRI